MVNYGDLTFSVLKTDSEQVSNSCLKLWSYELYYACIRLLALGKYHTRIGDIVRLQFAQCSGQLVMFNLPTMMQL